MPVFGFCVGREVVIRAAPRSGAGVFLLRAELARSYAADQMRIMQSGSERKDLLEAAQIGRRESVALNYFFPKAFSNRM
jgi:hypothetical protein